MKLRVSKIFVLVGVFVVCVFAIPSVANAQNVITGTVFNDARRPATDIDVELLDGFERFLKSTKTRGSGLYVFNNLRAGIYYISVRDNGTGLEASKIRISLGDTNVTRTTESGVTSTGGSEVHQENIFLQVNPRRKKPTANEVVYAQEIPKEAKDAYEKGIEYAKSDKTELADAEFLKATELFPDYYLALMELANSYLHAKDYEKAEASFDRAIKVNEKSFYAYFGIAVAQKSLNNKADAETNLVKAIALSPDNVSYYLMLGIIQRDLQKYTDAEKSFIKANTLSDNKEPDVHWNLALLYFNDLKRLDDAANELELYIKAAPEMPKEKKTETQNLIKSIRKKAKQT